MTNLYWFTNYDGENILNDFHGTEQEAVKYAEEQAKILDEDIYVNCGEDIVDVAFAQADQRRKGASPLTAIEIKFKEDMKHERNHDNY